MKTSEKRRLSVDEIYIIGDCHVQNKHSGTSHYQLVQRNQVKTQQPFGRTMEKRSRICKHLHTLDATALRVYRALYKVFIVCSSKTDRACRIKYKRCHTCRVVSSHHHSCLHCVFFGCQTHIREHALLEDHNFTVELTFGQVHCSSCGDYIYDNIFDSAALELKMDASTCRKRLFNWTFVETPELMSYNAKRICITPESTIGLRGLLNLGHTCFMNCVIQSLMHMPLLREYFLTERHKCTQLPNNCLVCELSKLFQDFYKGISTPLSLHKLLHLIWKSAKHLSGYEQQDAHEFFIAILEVFSSHEQSKSTQGNLVPEVKKDPRESSIIDQIFTGKIQSDVTCKTCKGVSTTIEQMKDIGLDLGESKVVPLNIKECLERYTRLEDLTENIKCSKCRSFQKGTKQVTIKTLPIVASFYFNRLQHLQHKEDSTVRKLSNKISFTETLDMSPYLYKDKRDVVYSADNIYSLFAVINHVGSGPCGHYTAYIRQMREYWYKCDDHIITRANLNEVLESEAYILFYHKNILLYD